MSVESKLNAIENGLFFGEAIEILYLFTPHINADHQQSNVSHITTCMQNTFEEKKTEKENMYTFSTRSCLSRIGNVCHVLYCVQMKVNGRSNSCLTAQ